MKNVLAIAGSDSSGGAGIQADLKTMCALEVYGMTVITAITAQNSRGVSAVEVVTPEVVKAQIEAVFTDIRVDAVKIGMIVNAQIAKVVADQLALRNAVNIVLDPVMVAKSGSRLIDRAAEQETLRLALAAAVVTPNLQEAALLAGIEVKTHADMEEAARRIQAKGAGNVLVKGGGRRDDADDFLLMGDEKIWLRQTRVPTDNIHGAGCTLSSAIAARLALGDPLLKAIQNAKHYVSRAIENSWKIGSGPGPLGHMAELYRQAVVPVSKTVK